MSSSHAAELKRVAEIYDTQAPTWDRTVGFTERLLIGSSIRKHLGSLLHGDVLEIGTGTGATIPYVTFGVGSVTSFTGTDLSAGMLRQVDRKSTSVRLARMSGDSLAFPDNTFDVVTCSLVLCTVPDPERALREMIRVCRDDGRIVLLEHVLAPNRLLAWLQRRMTPAQERRLGCHFDRQTDRLVQDMGFRVISERRRLFDIFLLTELAPPGS